MAGKGRLAKLLVHFAIIHCRARSNCGLRNAPGSVLFLLIDF